MRHHVSHRISADRVDQASQVDRAAVSRVVDDLATDDSARPGHDTQDRLCGDRLATARLADDAQRSPALECVAQAVDGADGIFVKQEVHAQVAHLEQDRSVTGHSASVRIGGVAQAVAQEVEGHNRRDQRQRRQHQPGRQGDRLEIVRVLEEHAP
jgi:hypothetical protein